MAPVILILLFSYKDPALIFKRDDGNTETMKEKFLIIIKNPVFVFVALGVASFNFVLSGYAFWVLFI